MRAVEILDVEESPRRFAEHIRIQSETGSVANGDLAVREAAGDQRAAPAQDRVLNDDRLGRLHRGRRHVAIKALERAAVRPARRDDKWAGQKFALLTILDGEMGARHPRAAAHVSSCSAAKASRAQTATQ